MKTSHAFVGNRGGIASTKSSFQGRKLARASDAALNKRVARLGLAPVAVAEVSAESKSPEQRGKKLEFSSSCC